MQLLSHTDHISSAQYPPVASGYHIGQHRESISINAESLPDRVVPDVKGPELGQKFSLLLQIRQGIGFPQYCLIKIEPTPDQVLDHTRFMKKNSVQGPWPPGPLCFPYPLQLTFSSTNMYGNEMLSLTVTQHT